MIYLDAGATTLQKPHAVALAVQSAMRRMATPGRGGHPPAMRAADAVYDCRCLAGALFDAQPEQVVFTMNATHALNLAIKTLVKPGGRAVISGFEHNAVLRPLHHLGAEIIVAGRRLFDPADAISAFDRAITPGTSAVICTHVSNVFGYILPVEEIAALCRARGVPFVLDASQSAGLLPVRLAELGADFIGMPGHKALYGPQGTGLLLCARMPDTLLEGGSGSASRLPDMPPELPDHAEAGTQNVCGICGLAAGLRFVRQQTPQRLLAHEICLRRLLASMFEDIPGIRLFTGEAQSGTLSLCAAQTDCESLPRGLHPRGSVCARACTARRLRTSPQERSKPGPSASASPRLTPSVRSWKSQSTSEAASNNAARHAPASAPLVRKGSRRRTLLFSTGPFFLFLFSAQSCMIYYI